MGVAATVGAVVFAEDVGLEEGAAVVKIGEAEVPVVRPRSATPTGFTGLQSGSTRSISLVKIRAVPSLRPHRSHQGAVSRRGNF